MALDSEVAWAAGFFDGEGCVTTNAAARPVVLIRIHQNDRRPLDRFQDVVGVGTVCGPRKRKSPDRYMRREYFDWSVAGSKALDVLQLLEPFLSEPKREQAAQTITQVAMTQGVRRWL